MTLKTFFRLLYNVPVPPLISFLRHSSVDGKYDMLIIPSVFGTSVVSAYV